MTATTQRMAKKGEAMTRPNNETPNPKVWHEWLESLPVGTPLIYRSENHVRPAVVVKANFPSVSGRAHIYNCAKFTDDNTLAYHIWTGCFEVAD